MAKEEENIFLDKIKLSFIVLEKESSVIEVYSNLIKRINAKYLKVEDVEESEDYDGSWNLAFELYSFIEYNKIASIEKKKKSDKELIKEIVELRRIMKKYENPEEKVNFKDLQTIMPTLKKLISLSGYHEDTFKHDETSHEPQFLPKFEGKDDSKK